VLGVMPRRRSRLLLACVAALVSASAGQGGQAPTAVVDDQQRSRAHEVRRATSQVTIDGVLDEPAWRDAAEIAITYEWFPGNNIEPPVETRAYLTFDAANLLIGFRASDPRPEQIRAHLMDRDQIDTLIQNDYVIVQIDTFNDQRRYFQFRVNPLGVQADALSSEVDRSEDWSWDMIWESRGRITADGYEVEIALPFNQLRFPNTKGPQTWGLDVGRSYPRSSRHRMSASGRDWDQSCRVCQFHKITGLQGLAPGRNLELDPTLTASRTDQLDVFPDGDLQTGEEEAEAGLTMRWGITPNLTMTGTLNPDFSQIEADVAQLDINQRFALFFEEKRPFFLEGGNFFNVLNRVVFTRTLVDPEWGFKLTGKQGRHGLGVFAAQDAVNSLVFPSNQGSSSTLLPRSVSSAVLRYRRDIGAASALGLLYTGREGDGYHNHVYGFDGFFRPRETDTLIVQYLRSDTRYPGAVATEFGQPMGSFDDALWEVRYERDTRKWNFALDYEDYGPGFRADNGFMPRVDMYKAQVIGRRRFWGGEDDWFDQVVLGAYANHIQDHDGLLTDEALQLFSSLAGPLQLQGDLVATRRKEYFDGVLYRDLDSVEVFAEVQPSGSVKLKLFGAVMDTIDYAHNRPADELQLNPAVEARIGRHINLNLDHLLQRLEVDGGELFEANLTQLRMVYNFNTRMFVRGIFQWLDVDRDAALHDLQVEPTVETLFTQLLFSYKVNARTVLFLGYSDNQRAIEDVERTRTDRTLFFKLGYAWIL
jgi:hypothetical protein